MKTSFHFPALLRKRGVALILVVSILSLLTILMLAMFTSTDNEFKSTQGYVASQDAKRLADLANNIVIAQLQKAAVPNPSNLTSRSTIHATQPGEVRVYNVNGSFNAAYKLYSSDTMQITGSTYQDELHTLDDAAAFATWDSPLMIDRYVDMNEPVIRAGTGTGGLPDVYFPIVDPTAYQVPLVAAASGAPPRSTSQANVEGFSYGIAGDVKCDGIVLPTGGAAGLPAQRLPMPVEWLYVLQDGSMGTMTAASSTTTGGTFTPATGGTAPTASNPIVGRVAFWTDDESCKININTASEETFWATPRFFHERDHEWAEKPPQAKEYQRFPGHPATVRLSSVLFPDIPGNSSFDFFGQTTAAATASTPFQQMQRIFDIAPKIARGGSFCGTQVYAADDQTGYTVAQQSGGVDVSNSVRERLYASVDELMYSQNMDTSAPALRLVNDQWVPPLPAGATSSSAATVISSTSNSVSTAVAPSLQATIQKSRFFLTANSRSPDFSMLGVPKVCMWPISQATDNRHRTVYDNLIAFTATLRNGTATNSNNIYYFQRGAATATVKPAHSGTYDIGISRNASLMNYLKVLLSSPMPATSYLTSNAGSAASLNDKYTPDNLHAILVQIFDYIRSTNLYDDILSANNVKAGTTTPQVAANLTNTQIYDSRPPVYYTYTDPMIWNQRVKDAVTGIAVSNGPIVAVDGWPGHGTVSPTLWTDGGTTYRGMGRFITISEIGLHLICTADGETDDGSYAAKGIKAGGRTSEKVSHKDQNVWMDASESMANKTYWYSNFPPYPGKNAIALYNLLPTNSSDLAIINKHPAWEPSQWNLTLHDDTAMTANQKRIQALLDIELFCPSEGYTIMHPEWTLVVPGTYLSGITVNKVALWNTTAPIVIKSNQNIYGTNTGVSRTGGSTDPADLYSGRGINGIDRLPADSTYDGSANSDPNAQLTNCGLASGFFTVASNQTIQLAFPSAGQGMLIKVYDTHNYLSAKEVQDINVDFAKAAGNNTISVPAPCLVTISTEWRHFLNGATMYDVGPMDAPHWWCFNHDGCVGRFPARSVPITAQNIGNYGAWVGKPIIPSTNTDTGTTAGRFLLGGNGTVISNGPPGYVKGAPTGYVNSTATNPPANAALIYSPPSLWQASSPTTWAHDYGADTIRTLIPALGDYRILAAQYTVPSNIWLAHPLWFATDNNGVPVYQAHNFSADNSDDSGFDFNLNSSNLPVKPQGMRALGTTVNMGSKIMDIPQDDGNVSLPVPWDSAALNALNSYGDFDNGQGTTRDGAYNNKPDEGNFASLQYIFGSTTQHNYRSAYFYGGFEMQTDPSNGGFSGNTFNTSYFTPNRLISSPVMFGSLVTNVFNPNAGFTSTLTAYPTQGCGRPWQTLLFRPHVQPTGDNNSTPGTIGGLASHPGAQNPPDHYLLDLFNMPVVEPYAISEPLSEAGKINLNYQIVPFTYIHRATAVYAAMKGELMRCVRTDDNNSGTSGTLGTIKYKAGATLPTGQIFPPINYWNETANATSTVNHIYWARHIDPVETLKQLDERFALNNSTSLIPGNCQGLLRSASQICELYMIPSNIAPNGTATGATLPQGMLSVNSSADNGKRVKNMEAFWGAHCLTGDNTREEIYAHLYPKFTTRSNTFRVHVRAQTLKKTRSTAANSFSINLGDSVVSEYRGSYLLERYIDPNDTTNILPDYGGSNNPLSLPPLDSFYRFHIIEAKRFNP